MSVAYRPLISYQSWHPDILSQLFWGSVSFKGCHFQMHIVRTHTLHMSRRAYSLIFTPHLLGKSFFIACRETSVLVKVSWILNYSKSIQISEPLGTATMWPVRPWEEFHHSQRHLASVAWCWERTNTGGGVGGTADLSSSSISAA